LDQKQLAAYTEDPLPEPAQRYAAPGITKSDKSLHEITLLLNVHISHQAHLFISYPYMRVFQLLFLGKVQL